MYQAKTEISHHLHDHRKKNNNDKPSYHHYNYNYNNNNNNNTLKVIYSSMLNNYQYSTWCLVRDFSEHDEIFHLERKKKKLNVFNDLFISLLSYGEVLALLLFVKLQNSSFLTRRLICLSWSLYFWSCLRGLWINNKQWDDVAFCRTGFQITLFVLLEANLLQKFLFYRLLKKVTKFRVVVLGRQTITLA